MITDIGKKVRVFIETAEGEMIDAHATAVNIQSTYGFGYVDSTIELRVIDQPIWVSARNWKESHPKSAVEWRCSFCGRPNKRDRETCLGCGAARSFIYG